MRILYVCLDRGVPIGGTKGASVHVAELVRALEAEGHETAILGRDFVDGAQTGVRFRAPTQAGLGWVPGRVLRRDLRELRARRALREAVRAAVEEFRPGVIYERYALFRGEGLQEARRAGVPHLLEVNAPLAWEERRFRGIVLRRAAERIEQRLWSGTDLVVTPSHVLAERVRSAGQTRVLVVPNAVDPERFRPGGERRCPPALEGRFVIGFAGSLKAWHDLDTLVAAAASLPPAPPVALLVVGEGPERTSLEQEAESLGVRLVVTGAVPPGEVAGYLRRMDACFAGLRADPELHYFSPLKVLEYLAAGRPTVVAAAGDLEAVAEAGAALSYRPGDAKELGTRLRSLVEDAELRGRLSQAGEQYAAGRTWRRAATEIVQAADRLLRTRSSA